MTNKEFQEILKKYPDDAIICIECCNPRSLKYDDYYNLIEID